MDELNRVCDHCGVLLKYHWGSGELTCPRDIPYKAPGFDVGQRDKDLYDNLVVAYKKLEEQWGSSLVCEGCGKEGRPVSYYNGSNGCVLCDHCEIHLEW